MTYPFVGGGRDTISLTTDVEQRSRLSKTIGPGTHQKGQRQKTQLDVGQDETFVLEASQ